MKFCQLVLGSAGTGKSTYCHVLQQHAAAEGRTMRIGNLDPAAETFRYTVSFDLRALISVEDVMEETALGPNGALLFAMEYLGNNLEWLDDQLEGFIDDDYLLLDCPGQIELYTHLPIMRRIGERLRAHGFNTCAVYCLDSTFVTDGAKLISGCLSALSAMVLLELPHVNVLTKVDLLPPESKERLESLLSPSGSDMAASVARGMKPRYKALNMELGSLLDSYDMVTFLPLDNSDEDSIANLLLHVDHAIQYGEDIEPKEPKDGLGDGEEGYGGQEEEQDQEGDGAAYDAAESFVGAGRLGGAGGGGGDMAGLGSFADYLKMGGRGAGE